MNTKRNVYFWIRFILVASLILSACSLFFPESDDKPVESTPTEVEAPTEPPTDTPVPTDTPLPTETPVPPTDTPIPSPTIPPATNTPTEIPPTATLAVSHVKIINRIAKNVRLTLIGPEQKSFQVKANSTYEFDIEPGQYEYQFEAQNFVSQNGIVVFPPGDFTWTWGKADN